ncbi:MAG: hypothetical protein Q9M45_04675 [Robiginitomaculum sp.]|nr:hypothetical protein [Robiginitomaculum sp.]
MELIARVLNHRKRGACGYDAGKKKISSRALDISHRGGGAMITAARWIGLGHLRGADIQTDRDGAVCGVSTIRHATFAGCFYVFVSMMGLRRSQLVGQAGENWLPTNGEMVQRLDKASV